MNSGTKILVIPRGMAIGIFIALIALIMLLAAFIFTGGSKDAAPSYAPSSTGVLASDSSAETQDTLYTPGVYTASIMLDNSPMSVKVTVDADNINAIDLIYTDEAVTTMYPMLGSCFNELAVEVCDKNSTKNISYSADNRYTAAVILKGIEAALAKAIIE
jgi:uncharacterized protein with FMN-binding domain